MISSNRFIVIVLIVRVGFVRIRVRIRVCIGVCIRVCMLRVSIPCYRLKFSVPDLI